MKIVELEPFGNTHSGELVRAFRLEGNHVRAEIITYGAILRVLEIDGTDGRPIDIALGYDTLAAYEQDTKFIGAIVGRCANRIAHGKFILNGTEYVLAQNDGQNHLHGGTHGFFDKVWKPSACMDGLHLTLESPDGEEGYPGNLRVEVIYSLDENDALSIEYHAVSDKDTVCNLTNHAYFNLAGADGGDILSQEIQLFSDYYTPTDAESIPHGAVLPVDGTPMDLHELTPFGAHIDDNFEQLQFAGGYDHNWVVRGNPGELRPAARVICKKTGLGFDIWTTQSGIQLYTSNTLAGAPVGKNGVIYSNRMAFCLETQAFPNAVNCPSFPTPVLRKEAAYHHRTIFALYLLSDMLSLG